MVPVVALLVAAMLLTGCDDGTQPVDAATQPAATDRCTDVETVPIQGEGHLVGDQEPPVPYNSTPPTSGWHTSTDIPVVVRPDSEPMTEPEQVTVLEMGGIVVTFNGLDPADRSALEQAITDKYAGQVALTSYDALHPGAVAFTAWGKLQHCDAVDLPALDAFVAAFVQR